LLDTVTDAVVASDDKFILTGWNAAAESTYGRRADEVLGQPDALVFRTDFLGVERAEAVQTLIETGRFHGELTHRRRDGKRIHIESRAAALFDSDGKRLGYVSVNRDITERRYAEQTIRALLSDVLTAQEAERRRIARELHDETAQTLTSLLVGLRAVEESQDLGQALGAASTLRGLVSAALEGVQRMARGLRPSILDDLGLEEALERLGADAGRASGFVIDVHATGPRLPRLPDALEIALYRIAQEAVVNANKHASPNAVSILIHRHPGEIRMVVEDDGKGFDVSETLSETQLGLIGMRERARLVGGSMTVESSPGKGTTICVSVPLPAEEATSS
jgi:PAS domain S-box-containing protein